MYVLVLILSLQGDIRAQSLPFLFPNWQTCTEVANKIRKLSMDTRPSPDATANTYCFQIPKSL